jgi:hypothetical protein
VLCGVLLIFFLLPSIPACSQKPGDNGYFEKDEIPKDDSVYTLAFMGDIMLGRENPLPPDGAKGFFKVLLPTLKGET